ncbi:phosphoribosyltransferase [Catellatospora citrea]|uniref:Phosphoribosyltransferase domain-containing protein n=1 Tax=Catellatospora citrea TaxID=53366 RepID=A0A8J3KF42_9ACTN|nr:phosphoribosyltransferase family protein [Catellatospora citrea]RKE07893.1 hypothetical protein C8E86_2732 [Catellatospora citrea]GIG02097.1 hypothetical protein Cci01nite_71900 [Catellatospora citrea]
MTSQRTFAHTRVLTLTDEVVDHAIGMLGSALVTRFGQPGAIIGIANGGLVPAEKLAAKLVTSRFWVAARHNATDDLYSQATGQVTTDVTTLSAALEGHRLPGPVVLVDDICGTGATFDALRPSLHPLVAPDARVLTVTLCLNEGSPIRPDLWAWTVGDWVRFPWEGHLPGGQPQEPLPLPRRINP